MKNSIDGIVKRKIIVCRKYVDIVDIDVIEFVFNIKVSDVNHCSLVEPQEICMVKHVNVMWNLLKIQQV